MSLWNKLFGSAAADRPETNRENLTKKEATDLKQPWVNVTKFNVIDSKDPSNIEIELDWNIFFIDELKSAGYNGKEEEDIIEQWFHDLCRGIVDDI
jgi:hypothetical protein